MAPLPASGSHAGSRPRARAGRGLIASIVAAVAMMLLLPSALLGTVALSYTTPPSDTAAEVAPSPHVSTAPGAAPAPAAEDGPVRVAGAYVSTPSTPNPAPAALITVHRPPCPDPAAAGVPARSVPIAELRPAAGHSLQGTLSWAVSDAPEITAMSRAITNSFEANAVTFPGVRGPVAGFFPGRDYNEVYIRDTATAMLVAPYLFPDPFLRTTVEEFLYRQFTSTAAGASIAGQPSFPGADAVYGLMAPGGWADKSTATSDEEPSLVTSAYRYVQSAGGKDWLACNIQGRTVKERLHGALAHLVASRTDPATGLVVRAHTTDWGDIRMQGGSHPTHADTVNETWTVSMYDQAVIYQAMRQMAELSRLAADPSAGAMWDQQADRLRVQANRFLWQPARGFYRTHIHTTAFSHSFDEDRMVSIANAVAVYAGLADETQARQIFGALETARLAAGVAKPGLALYPPYDGGVFQHPNMDHWSYQNGGQWDWWGAVQITAEFLNGHSDRAFAHLTALGRSWQAHPGTIIEWQDPFGGTKQGSADYTGTAGTAGEAVIRGLFGVELAADGFALRPRLGARWGFIHVQLPVAGHALWARQRIQDRTLMLEYTAVHPGHGVLEVLLPKDMTPAAAQFDGVAIDLHLREVGDDRFLSIGAVPAGNHRLDVTLRPEPAPAARLRWEQPASGHGAGGPGDLRGAGPAVEWRAARRDRAAGRGRPVDRSDGREVTFAGADLRAPLERAVAPGEVPRVALPLTAPPLQGRYLLRVSLGRAQGTVPASQAAQSTADIVIQVVP